MTSETELLHLPLAEQILATRKTVGFARIETLCYLEVTGPDAASFLQNRLSNDVALLTPGAGQMNAVLDRQGKIEGVFSLYKTDEIASSLLGTDTPAFFMLLDPAEAESAVRGILKYKIVEQLALSAPTAAEHPVILSIQGPMALEVLKSQLPEITHFSSYSWVDSTVSLPDHSEPIPVRCVAMAENEIVLLVSPTFASLMETHLQQAVLAEGGVILFPEALEVMRVEAGIPRFGKDYSNDTLLPETGLERVAVSYSKGCYLGQETIARVKTYGALPRILMGLIFDADTPLLVPMALLLDGKAIGTMTSCAFSPTLGKMIGLAYLSKETRIPGKTLPLKIVDSQVNATVALLPFVDNAKSVDLLKEGLRLFSEGYETEAIDCLRKHITALPDSVEGHEALGVMLSRAGQFDEAIALMERVLVLDPSHVLAHTNLSVYWMKLGDKDKAEDEKAKATMAAFSRHAKAAGLSFDPEAERRKKEAALRDKVQMFEEALKFNPTDALGNFGLGSVYLELNEFASAIDPFQKTIAAQPKHSVAYLSLAKALIATDRIPEARQVLETGIEIAAARGDRMPLEDMQHRLRQIETPVEARQ